MNERDIRLDEVKVLEDYLNRHGIQTDNPDGPIRRYARQRRGEINAKFARNSGVGGGPTRLRGAIQKRRGGKGPTFLGRSARRASRPTIMKMRGSGRKKR